MTGVSTLRGRRYYIRADADQAVAIAEEVVTYCERQILQAR